MFHDGDLQSGIALAVQQSKAVFCFIHDQGEDSHNWETTILDDVQVAGALRANAVALRIAAGSQEAQHLSSFCPINAVPAAVIIQKGVIAGVISHAPTEQLKSRILALFSLPLPQAATDAARNSSSATTVAYDNPSENSEISSQAASSSILQESPNHSMPVPTPTSSSTPSSSTSEDGQQQPLASHDTRIEESSEQVPGGQTSSDSQNASESKLPPGKSTPQQNWARMQRERERRQREERERIKAQIRHDHAERRRGEEIRRQSGDDPTINDHSTKKPSSSSEVRIQVRTFDGSTFRSTFPKGATIGDQIRPWIDSSIEQTAPYTLKIILTPRPNKTIEAAEEGKSLEDLEIVGSCTLVMNPVKEYVESYAPTGSDTVGSAVSGGYNLLSSSVGAVFGGVRSMLGLGQTITPQGPLSAPQGPSSRPASGQVRVRTLADQRIEAQKEDQQFYNGNQLNFEPRKDDDTDKSL